MSFLVWNCRVLENLHTGKELIKVVVRAKNSSIVFIVETWADEVRPKRNPM